MTKLMIDLPKDVYERIIKDGCIEKYGSDISTVTQAIKDGVKYPGWKAEKMKRAEPIIPVGLNLDSECKGCPAFIPKMNVEHFYTNTDTHYSIDITCKMIEQCRWLKKQNIINRGQQS